MPQPHTLMALLTAALIVLPSFALHWRNLRRSRSGLCYRCGGAPFDAQRVRLRTSPLFPDDVVFCGACARQRRRWGWLVFALLLLLVLLVWNGMRPQA